MDKITKSNNKNFDELIRFGVDLSMDVALDNNFVYDSYDEERYCMSFYDSSKSYKLLIFLTTMTVGLFNRSVKDDFIYYKNQTFEGINDILKRHNRDKRKLTKGY